MTARLDVLERVRLAAAGDLDFRAKLLRDPRRALFEKFNCEIPDAITVRVVEEQPSETVIVIPALVNADEYRAHFASAPRSHS